MFSDDKLLHNLEESINKLDKLAVNVFHRASALGIDPFDIQTPSGELMLAPIVIARAHAFAAYTNLRAQQIMAEYQRKLREKPPPSYT